MLITTMFIQLSEFNFAHGQPTCKALYCEQVGCHLQMQNATDKLT